MAQPALQPLAVLETVDASFTIYRRRFKDLVVISAIILIPVSILSFLISYFVFDTEIDPDNFVASDLTGVFVGTLVLTVVSFLGTLIITGAVAKSVGDAYVGVDTPWGDSMGKAVNSLGRLVGNAILNALGVFVGFILCILPGIYLAVRWVTAPVTVILEDRGPAEALGRSGNLVKGRWWPVFGVVLIGYVIQIIIGAVIGGIFAVFLVSGGEPGSAGVVAATSVIDLAVGIFLQPFLAVLITVIYFDLRVRKEGFDLERLAEQLGTEPPATLPPTPQSDWDEGWSGEPGSDGGETPPDEPPSGENPFG